MFYLNFIVLTIFALLVGCGSTPEKINVDAGNSIYSLSQDAIIATPDCSGWSEKYMIFPEQSSYSKHSCFPTKIVANVPRGTVLREARVIKKFSLGYGYLWRVKAYFAGYEEYGLIEIPACSLWHPKSWIDCEAIRDTPSKLKFNPEYIGSSGDSVLNSKITQALEPY